MASTLKRLGDIELPIDYKSGKTMSEAEKFSVVSQIGSFILDHEPELRQYSGDLAKKIYGLTGSGIGFSVASIYAMLLYSDD